MWHFFEPVWYEHCRVQTAVWYLCFIVSIAAEAGPNNARGPQHEFSPLKLNPYESPKAKVGVQPLGCHRGWLPLFFCQFCKMCHQKLAKMHDCWLAWKYSTIQNPPKIALNLTGRRKGYRNWWWKVNYCWNRAHSKTHWKHTKLHVRVRTHENVVLCSHISHSQDSIIILSSTYTAMRIWWPNQAQYKLDATP